MTPAGTWRHVDGFEARAFEYWVNPTEFRHGFDPIKGAHRATSAEEGAGRADAAIVGMQDDASQADQLAIHGSQRQSAPATRTSEVAVARRE